MHTSYGLYGSREAVGIQSAECVNIDVIFSQYNVQCFCMAYILWLIVGGYILLTTVNSEVQNCM